MSHLKNIILLAISVALMLIATSVRASAIGNAGRRTDSLHATLPSLEGEAKLNALWGIAKAERDAKAGMDAEWQAIDLFLREARLQKNKDMEAEAMMMLLVHYLNNGDKEHYFAISKDAGEFYLDNGYTSQYWEYLFLEVKALLYSNKQESAIKFATEMYDRAKSQNDIYGIAITAYLMGNAYELADKDDAAMEAFREAWSYTKQIKNTAKRNRLIYYCAPALVREYNRTKQYDRSLGILEEWSENIEESRVWAIENDEGVFQMDVSQIHCDMLRAETYAYTGNFDEAEEYLSGVEIVVDNYPPLVKNYYLYIKCIFHKEKGEYEEALAADIRLKDYYAEKGEAILYNETMLDIWYILKTMGRYKDAVALGDEIITLSDSLNSAENLMQLNELKTIYEVDKLEAQKQRQTIVILSVSVGCFLLAVIIAIYILYSLNLKRKTASLYNQIQEMTRAEREASRILELIPETELSREMKLFRELTALMHTEKLFLDPAVDRRSVASRLGTNAQYLANAIHEGAPNTTFSNYISGLRLAYSLDLLTGHPDMTLEAVAEESGHGSYSPFFKAFVKKYGISPSEYRRQFSAKSV